MTPTFLAIYAPISHRSKGQNRTGVAGHVCLDVEAKVALEGDVDFSAEGISERVLELDELDEAERRRSMSLSGLAVPRAREPTRETERTPFAPSAPACAAKTHSSSVRRSVAFVEDIRLYSIALYGHTMPRNPQSSTSKAAKHSGPSGFLQRTPISHRSKRPKGPVGRLYGPNTRVTDVRRDG